MWAVFFLLQGSGSNPAKQVSKRPDPEHCLIISCYRQLCDLGPGLERYTYLEMAHLVLSRLYSTHSTRTWFIEYTILGRAGMLYLEMAHLVLSRLYVQYTQYMNMVHRVHNPRAGWNAIPGDGPPGP